MSAKAGAFDESDAALDENDRAGELKADRRGTIRLRDMIACFEPGRLEMPALYRCRPRNVAASCTV